MDDDLTFALEIGNKVFTFKNKDTLLFCADFQTRKKYKNLKNKVVIVKIEVDDIIKEEHEIRNDEKFKFDEELLGD